MNDYKKLEKVISDFREAIKDMNIDYISFYKELTSVDLEKDHWDPKKFSCVKTGKCKMRLRTIKSNPPILLNIREEL